MTQTEFALVNDKTEKFRISWVCNKAMAAWKKLQNLVKTKELFDLVSTLLECTLLVYI